MRLDEIIQDTEDGLTADATLRSFLRHMGQSASGAPEDLPFEPSRDTPLAKLLSGGRWIPVIDQDTTRLAIGTLSTRILSWNLDAATQRSGLPQAIWVFIDGGGVAMMAVAIRDQKLVAWAGIGNTEKIPQAGIQPLRQFIRHFRLKQPPAGMGNKAAFTVGSNDDYLQARGQQEPTKAPQPAGAAKPPVPAAAEKAPPPEVDAKSPEADQQPIQSKRFRPDRYPIEQLRLVRKVALSLTKFIGDGKLSRDDLARFRDRLDASNPTRHGLERIVSLMKDDQSLNRFHLRDLARARTLDQFDETIQVAANWPPPKPADTPTSS